MRARRGLPVRDTLRALAPADDIPAAIRSCGSALEEILPFLAGDVVPARYIDQILPDQIFPSPGDPTLLEPYDADAREQVKLAKGSLMLSWRGRDRP